MGGSALAEANIRSQREAIILGKSVNDVTEDRRLGRLQSPIDDARDVSVGLEEDDCEHRVPIEHGKATFSEPVTKGVLELLPGFGELRFSAGEDSDRRPVFVAQRCDVEPERVSLRE